jgi:hypothetical protein
MPLAASLPRTPRSAAITGRRARHLSGEHVRGPKVLKFPKPESVVGSLAEIGLKTQLDEPAEIATAVFLDSNNIEN